jgi:peptidoglycan/xylan/chitin deacetylase (PgdA/CDA1 family)
MNPISVAVKGKGLFSFLERGASIFKRYGLSPGKVDCELAEFAAVLDQFGCSASFPITSVALERHPQTISKYQAQGIEFAIHGYRHLDHSQLSRSEQKSQLESAKQIFAQADIPTCGFRAPYLRWSEDTLGTLRQLGLAYDSSQGIAWDVLNGDESPAYKHVLGFYRAVAADDYPSLPSLENGLVRIPYSLPDDEALVERLDLESPSEMTALWQAILDRTYELGELFTVGLHPERTTLCLEPLKTVLTETQSLAPPVWIARLDEIASWWRDRFQATVGIEEVGADRFRWTVVAPPETTVLARGAVEIDAPTQSWTDQYRLVDATTFTMQAATRPWIGLSQSSSPRSSHFLRQQGFVVEVAAEPGRHAYYLDEPGFSAEDERRLLRQIEETDQPLVRMGRWPNGAQSALSITGDIDALTLWDYLLRFLGR